MHILIFFLAILWSAAVISVPLAPEDIPEPLEPWVAWVKHAHTDLDCPIRFSDDGRSCVWPGELEIRANASGAAFTQALNVYRRSEIRLPGDSRHWPVNVRWGEQLLAVVERNGAPYVLLDAGRYQIAGEFEWSSIPPSLGVPAGIGIVRYFRNDVEVPLPQLRKGSLWMRDGSAVEQSRTPEDRLDLEVYRLVADGHPGRIVTHLALEVSGKQREVVLGRPNLAGFVPVQIESQLPVRLEAHGALRVQVRPGRWVIRVRARLPSEMSELRRTDQAGESAWPDTEVWVYRASPSDRLTEITGARQIDPRQVRLPKDWANLPAYEVTADVPFTIKTLRRGDPDPEPDSLSLSRDFWLDFDGEGLTVRDQITGKMTSGWRLSADEGFDLGRVTIDGKPQFITRLPGQSRNGVEVRLGQLNLSAESRFEGSSSEVPAIGWGRDFQRVEARLHLPPGYQVLTVSGVDNVPASWLQRWTLYDVFLVLIVTLGVGKLWGWKWTPLAMVTLGLVWHEDQAPRMIWLYLLAVVALLRVVPPSGRIYDGLRIARVAGLLALLVITLPFMAQQAREGLYPQLEYRHGGITSAPASTVAQDAPAPREDEARRSTAPSIAREVYQSAGKAAKYVRKPVLDQIDPSATIQTGPGLPSWHWRTARLSWNGPVAADQRIGIVLIGPRVHLVLGFVMIGLLLVLSWRFLDLKRDSGRWKMSYLLLALLAGFSGNSGATGFPPPELLEQLEQRLLKPATQSPRAAIASMNLVYRSDRYVATFSTQSLQETAIPLPVDVGLMVPVSVKLDSAPAGDRLLRNERNQLWLLIPQGQHTVRLSVVIPPVEQFQIPLPLRPHLIRAEGTGWSVEGIDRHLRPQTQLSLVRIREEDAASQGELAPSVLPPFLRVERTIHFGIHWEVSTRVLRDSPTGTPISVQVPVLPGASVVSDGLTVEKGRVLVNMAAGQREVTWQSRLDPVETLTLTAPTETDWIETWRADIGSIWHVGIEGIAPIHHQDSARNWLPAWHPWPGEQVVFKVERPQGVEGNTTTIDRSHLTVKPGKRATDSTLSFRLRASQGGKHKLELPAGAALLSVKVNGRTQPIRAEDGGVNLPVVPGEQTYELVWRQMAGMDGRWQTPAIDLGRESVNASLTVHAPHDRWTLWLSGPTLGPAVLFWGVLSVVVVVALILARIGRGQVPLGLVSWVLLGIGMTQVSVFGLVLVAAWFFAIRYRSTMVPDDTKENLGFNLAQVAIVLLSLAAAMVLLGAVQNGLLGRPAMLISGNQSSSYLFNWYQDRLSTTYPQTSVYSAPLWVYRGLMMAWALWLAFSLLAWIKWGWQAFSTGGLWRDLSFHLRMPGKRSTHETADESKQPGSTLPQEKEGGK